MVFENRGTYSPEEYAPFLPHTTGCSLLPLPSLSTPSEGAHIHQSPIPNDFRAYFHAHMQHKTWQNFRLKTLGVGVVAATRAAARNGDDSAPPSPTKIGSLSSTRNSLSRIQFDFARDPSSRCPSGEVQSNPLRWEGARKERCPGAVAFDKLGPQPAGSVLSKTIDESRRSGVGLNAWIRHG